MTQNECSTCTNPRDTDCMYCVKGSRYEGPDSTVTHSVGLYPTVTIRRSVIKGSEDSNFKGAPLARSRKQK